MTSAIRRVLIADDHDVVRRGVRTVLEARPNLQVVAEAANGRQALEEARVTKPDIAVIDYSLPEMNGLDLAKAVTCAEPYRYTAATPETGNGQPSSGQDLELMIDEPSGIFRRAELTVTDEKLHGSYLHVIFEATNPQ